ncbi:hypothetical protein AB1Y20_006609 [Prymnesium parvum]|uniref:Centrosomal protein of 162 kDa n=1 Tax=Prymnesium parvum TaxID=97485 RepID=A0AB34IYW1_PRYPA
MAGQRSATAAARALTARPATAEACCRSLLPERTAIFRGGWTSDGEPSTREPRFLAAREHTLPQLELQLARLSKELAKAHEQRDTALAQLSATRHELARLRGRSEAQKASRVYVNLDETRSVLAETQRALGSARATLASTREQHKQQFIARTRKDESIQKTARDRLEMLMEEIEVLKATNAHLRQEIVGLRAQLRAQLTVNPPGALDDSRARVARQEQLLEQQLKKNAALRGEMETWRARACNALACERLTALHAGPNAMFKRVDEVDTSRCNAEEEEQLRKLHCEIDFWKEEAMKERERQALFLQALWATDTFSQDQKQQLAQLLRVQGLPSRLDEVSMISSRMY